MRFIFLTMDGNHAGALREAAQLLQRDQGITLSLGLYDATTLRDAGDWARLNADIARADFIFGSMLFGEDYIRPLEPALDAAACPICVITANPSLIYKTRLGKFTLKPHDEASTNPLMAWAQKLRPKKGHGHSEGKRQLAMVRGLSSLMAHIPGKARDLHTYIAAHQYWLHASPENLRRLLCLLIARYVPGNERLKFDPPIEYPNVALFHPQAAAPFAELAEFRSWRQNHNGVTSGQGGTVNSRKDALPRDHATRSSGQINGTVGLLSLRTVALSGNTAHLDALITALEARGLEVLPAYSAGLDFRPAIEQFFTDDGRQTIDDSQKTRSLSSGGRPSSVVRRPSSGVDLLINAAGFSLVGGMAESRPGEARAALEALDVGYIDAIPLAFQRVEEWRRDDTGLSPIQIAMNVAVPELDSAAEPLVYGGPTEGSDRFVPLHDQIEVLADRVAKRVTLHRKTNAEKRIAITLFNFPPNLGNVGTAAYLDVFASLHRLLLALQAQGYTLDVPPTAEELRRAVVEGNAVQYGTDSSVAARLPVAEYRRLFPDYADIEPFWGTAPGELLNDGQSFFILGLQLGNVFVGVQPSFGYERDPMRLLMAKDAAPHHGFAAFYTYLRCVWQADAVLHFGTHGALEFMPGKQVGMSANCWPMRLLGSLPNFYYYSVNNPSEATIAKRRSLATLVSYMVPPLQQAGLYKGLRVLKDSIETYRARPNAELLADIRVQAERLQIAANQAEIADSQSANEAEPEQGASTHLQSEAYITSLAAELLAVEQRFIPIGLHVLGGESDPRELADLLALVATFHRLPCGRTLPQLLAAEHGWNYDTLQAEFATSRVAQERYQAIEREVKERIHSEFFVSSSQLPAAQPQNPTRKPQNSLAPLWSHLATLLANMQVDGELPGIMHALAGGYIAPSPGNDVARNPAVVPTGRNIHGLDPFRVPTAAAQAAGTVLMRELLASQTQALGHIPESIALVLWGTDNLKSDGEGVAQALALFGAQVVQDELGNVADVELIPLAELGRPRIDVVMTVSGIFRDLFGHQMALLDKAARLAATTDEPCELNFVRKHALAQAEALGTTLDLAATRVFANAAGSYGANVNHVVESGTWENDGELAEVFMSRKSFAYGKRGEWREARGLLEATLATVEVSFQNIDSFELGISDIDHYYENLGGITKSIEKLRGVRPPVLVADALATAGGRLNTLERMVRIEARAKLLNPKWYEGMLKHGYEGVREIETRVSNTYGWSATTGAVEGWVYQDVAETFLLDDAMRERMAGLNPHATAAIARRLLEANDRALWQADAATLEQLQQVYADLEDRLEGVVV